MQARHAVNALLSPHRTPIHHPDIAYRTRLCRIFRKRHSLHLHGNSLVPMAKRTNKGFTTYVFSQAALPSCTLQTLFRAMTSAGNRSDGMPCILYLLAAKRLIVQVEHRYVGIGHCNRPGCIQRKMLRQAVHSLSHIVPACTHGITIAAVRQPELRQKINQDTGCIPGVYRKNDTQSVGFRSALRVSGLASGNQQC